jgi:hypothetical protein
MMKTTAIETSIAVDTEENRSQAVKLAWGDQVHASLHALTYACSQFCFLPEVATRH